MTAVREAVGVFESVESLEAAIDDLEESGFDRACLSLLASESAVEEKLGRSYMRVESLEDNPDVPRAAFVSEESVGAAEGGLVGGFLYVAGVAAFGGVVASGGALAAAIAALAVAAPAGALLGATLAGIVGAHHADYLYKQLEKGGLLLWVRTFTPADETEAVEILSKHSAHDVHVHDLELLKDEVIDHEGVEIRVHRNGTCSAQGRDFSTLGAARSFIDQELRTE